MLTAHRSSIIALFSTIACLGFVSHASATLLNLPDIPLGVDGSKTALVQLVVERDNKLFYEAYPTYEDINGDGVLDNKYKPEEIDYYGYFGSDFCYTHNGSFFTASSYAVDKKCLSDSTSWSGDFLNYATMTRMDIMLRALYGGRRSIDTASQTVLRRAFVPWENHTWGIEFESESVNGYKISDYTPLNEPRSGLRHHFATNNTTGSAASLGDTPYLRIRENTNQRIWDWVEKERTQGDGYADQDIIVDVEVCTTGFLEDTCSLYPEGNYKPTGILHTYGENNSMYFSLLTGSFQNNKQGGVLRKAMSSFRDELNPDTGAYVSSDGIVNTLNSIQIPNDFRNQTVQRDCAWLARRTFNNGECRAWGNPVAEMMFEGMRYLSGAGAPTPMFHDDAAASTSMDSELGLTAAAWDDPYSASQPYGQCSSAYQLVISDPSPSFDADQLPGSHFGSFSESTLGSLNVGTIADFISQEEDEIPGLKFIGEADGVNDRAPSAKQVTTLKTVRGLAPDSPHREGSYYASSVAYYGHQNDLQPTVDGDQTVGNFTLAMGSALPTIRIDANGNDIQMAPFGQSVGGCGTSINNAVFTPNNAIVGFVVESTSADAGSFRVSFEDMEQGADNDMDAVARYEYRVLGDEVEVKVTSMGASGCYIQHLGYSISGTTADGVYLVVRDEDTRESADVDFKFDVPPGNVAGSANWSDGDALPLVSTIRFRPSSTPAAKALKSPLWYAAKWGGFSDINNDGIPQTQEWDKNGDGDPDNYFNATDPSLLAGTLGRVFSSISSASNNVSMVSVTGSSLTSNSRIFETSFNTGEWFSSLSSRAIDGSGNLADDVDWEVDDALKKQVSLNNRTIITYKPSTQSGIAFRWPANENSPSAEELDIEQTQLLSIDPTTGVSDSLGSARLDFIRGNHAPGFRARNTILGDVVSSSVEFVGAPGGYYSDDWGTGEPESSTPYSEFVTQYAERQRVVYVGANDGMLHGFNAGEYSAGSYDYGDGSEVFAYVPSPVYKNLSALTDPNYSHKFFVDASPNIADVLLTDQWRTVLVGGLGKGGQGVYALDITDVGQVSEINAEATVLWEFTEEDDSHLGYTYSSPLITRMHNGRWVAIFGNGYNSREVDGHQASNGRAAIFIVDLETGDLIKKMETQDGSSSRPNGINAPTAVDLDNDNIVDIIYATDTRGVLSKYDVRASDPKDWGRISDQMFYTVDRTGNRNESNSEPVTTQLAVGSHPTGEGVLLFLATGKYLEPTDLNNNGDLHKIYALWDKDPFVDPNLRGKFPRKFLEQSITSEHTVFYDTDGDGIDDASTLVRESTQHEIDWTNHLGWYMDLEYTTSTGEQVVAQPLLREGRVFISTYIPTGDECTPESSGWLMILDAASGAMPETAIDLNGDGKFTPDETLTGINSGNNPFAPPTLIGGEGEDIILTSNPDGTGTTSSTLDSTGLRGRVSWRELEP